jgi:cytochrome c
MDSFEFTKIAAAVLCALLVIFGTRTALEIAETSHKKAEAAGYALPAPAAAPTTLAADATGTAPAAPAGFSFDAVKPLLAAASLENGQAIFKKCSACHAPEKGGANKVGPALWGIVGRKIGGQDGFQYSQALSGKGGEWTYENLALFAHNPKAFATGTKMVFAGISDNQQIADLLTYLRSLSDEPAPLP